MLSVGKGSFGGASRHIYKFHLKIYLIKKHSKNMFYHDIRFFNMLTSIYWCLVIIKIKNLTVFILSYVNNKQPHQAAVILSNILAIMYDMAVTICPFWMKCKHSKEKAEKVVKPPKNPVSKIIFKEGTLEIIIPAKKPPKTLTSKVATGIVIIVGIHNPSK